MPTSCNRLLSSIHASVSLRTASLPTGLPRLSLIHQVQKEETHVAYTETRYTEDFGQADDKVQHWITTACACPVKC